MNILLTGANGFTGQHVNHYLTQAGHRVTKGDRKTGWHTQLDGCDAVVHLAAKVHVLQESYTDEEAFTRDNVEASVTLARQAAKAGVKRFVFISSIGVHGMAPMGPLTETSAIDSSGPYSASKWAAERALASIDGIEIVTLRPPLIYGPGVKANFLSLMKAIKWGLPMPLGLVKTKRDYLSTTNFASAIHFVLTQPEAAGETYLVRDGEALSTASLIRHLATYMQKPYCLWPFPPALLKAIASAFGKNALYESVCGAREIDDRKLRALGWQPAQTIDDGLRETVEWFK